MKKLILFLFIAVWQANSKSPPEPVCDQNNGNLKIGGNCVSCSDGCKTCSGNAFWYQCSSCFSGYELLNNLCLPKAHLQSTSFEFNSQTNLGMEQNQIFQVGSNSNNKYPDYDANDPYPTFQRGYYYTNLSYMTSDKFNLSPWFSNSFWIKPYSAGNIFLKKDTSSALLSLSISSSNVLAYSIKLAHGVTLSLHYSTINSVLNVWNQIAITCDLDMGQWVTKIQLIHNGEVITESQATTQDWYNDPPIAIIGNDPKGSQTFTGFIWSWKYYANSTLWHADYQISTYCASGCLFCSEDFTCPDYCDFGQFNENGVCVDCLSECTYGCRTGERCNICETKECYSCSDSFVCDTCVTRGNLTNKVCECNLNSFFNETTKICDICDNSYCSQCLTVNYFDCKVCGPNYKLIDTVCLVDTPSGWDNSKTKPYVAYDIPFWTGAYQGEFGIFETGEDKTRYGPFNILEELMDPIPIENRGLYFSNGNFLNSSPIYLPHSFTMIICINPKNGDFLEKESMSINSNGKASIYLQDPLNNLVHIVTHSEFPLKDWTYFTLVFSYFNSTTTLSAYSNGNLLFLHSYYAWIYRDFALSSMHLGKSQDSVYDGFIYIYLEIIGQISDIVSYVENEASLNQLPSCDYDYTFDQNGTCISCNSSCTMGCIRESNCNLCHDQLCRNCSGPLEESTCFNCSWLSHNLYPNECICDDNAFLIKNSSNWYCEHCEYNYCAFCNDNGHFECKGCKSGVLVNTVCLDEYPLGYFECSGKNCLLTQINPNEYFRGRYGIFIGGSTKELFPHFNGSEK
ncbi:unnamed protein product [Blepharisma stoltei]|uniref:TNFR-Cys domain-containing protein n=1 Tax=Blepharisma stoltei TaxID=1481888 RepID=A0AAU9KIY4_9CILI|nr:unnamed protein product [Blepharisma stoltei]